MKCFCDNEKPTIEINGGQLYCQKCNTLVDETVFQQTSENEYTRPPCRLRKYTNFLNDKALEWYERETLLGLFPMLEQYFNKHGNRHNFYNMNGLSLEMCRLLKYESAAAQFRPMYRETLQSDIRMFVKGATNKSVKVGRPFPTIQDLEYLKPDPEINQSSINKQPNSFFRVFTSIQRDDKLRMPRQKSGPKRRNRNGIPDSILEPRPKFRICLRPKAKPNESS